MVSFSRICAGFGETMSIIAVILLIFGNIGQIRPTVLLSKIRLAHISTAGLASAIETKAGAAAIEVTANLYYTGSTDSGSVEAGQHKGLMKGYEFGLWGYCATPANETGSTRAYCSTTGFGTAFQPLSALYGDIPVGLETAFNSTVPASAFVGESYLSQYSGAANYLVFVGSIFALLSLLTGLIAKRLAYFCVAISSTLGFVCLTVGLGAYTVLFQKVIQALNAADIGVTMAFDNGLWILWAADCALVISILPYFIACCTSRKTDRVPGTPSMELQNGGRKDLEYGYSGRQSVDSFKNYRY